MIDRQEPKVAEFASELTETDPDTALTDAEAARRLAQFGPNEIEENRVNPWLRFLAFFWGPIPWMIEIAAVLSAAVAHWEDFTIILIMLLLTLGLVALIFVVARFRHDPLAETLLFALILTVAAIPVALPAVLSVTMAVGAVRLARMKAIVSRLVSNEEMAGMDLLCSDKTATLTKNQLAVGEPEAARIRRGGRGTRDRLEVAGE